ncbi:MAG: tetratricopeptide repeat protein [Sphingorhabdus sp.]
MNQYANARLAELGGNDAEALKSYLRLGRDAPESRVLAERVYESAIRSGDMAAAVRAVRAQELIGDVSAEAPLLLFADAFKKKNWSLALLATNELSTRSNLAFMAPILHSWINVAQGNPHDLVDVGNQSDPIFAYYSNDQRVYLDLATGDYAKASVGLRNMALVGGEHVRDLFLRAAPIMAKQGDTAFTDALISHALGNDRQPTTRMPTSQNLTPQEGLAAFHTRIANALLEQDIIGPALVLARVGQWMDPANEAAKLAVARALVSHSQYSPANELLITIDSTSPYWLRSIGERIKIHNIQGSHGAALAVAKEGVARWPKSVGMTTLLAQALENMGDRQAAIIKYRELVDLAEQGAYNPRQRANLHLALASVLDRGGDWAAAKLQLETAALLDPNNAQILNYLGYSMLEKRDEPARALALVQKAFEIAPDSIAITDSMGWAFYRNGQVGQALPLLEKAAKGSGSDAAINEHLGDAYWATGRYRDARYAWRTASQDADADAAKRLAHKLEIGLVETNAAP